MATTILILFGGIFLGAVLVGIGFLAWKFMKVIIDATQAIKELSALSGNAGISSLVLQIAAIADAGPGIISSLKTLNDTVQQFYKVALINSETIAKESAAPKKNEDENSGFYPYNETLAAALEEDAIRKAAGRSVPDSELPKEAVVGQV